MEGFTIDTIYRGKVIVNNTLLETSSEDKVYFYLEFYEAQVMEFWAKYIEIK